MRSVNDMKDSELIKLTRGLSPFQLEEYGLYNTCILLALLLQGLEAQTKEITERQWSDKSSEFDSRQKGKCSTGNNLQVF